MLIKVYGSAEYSGGVMKMRSGGHSPESAGQSPQQHSEPWLLFAMAGLACSAALMAKKHVQGTKVNSRGKEVPLGVRLYSIASTRYGDFFDGQTASLCVRRATFWDAEKNAEDPAKKGICSNFLCDAKPGTEITLTGQQQHHPSMLLCLTGLRFSQMGPCLAGEMGQKVGTLPFDHIRFQCFVYTRDCKSEMDHFHVLPNLRMRRIEEGGGVRGREGALLDVAVIEDSAIFLPCVKKLIHGEINPWRALRTKCV
jgi:hypothetical protein